MRLSLLSLSLLVGAAVALPGSDSYSSAPNDKPYPHPTPSQYNPPTDPSDHPDCKGDQCHPPPTYVTPPPTYTNHPDCGDKCGGTCGDKIVQYPQEECDLGPELNGKPGSGCTKDCKKCGFCGDRTVDSGEEVSCP